jgi:hypothetical protein
MDSDRTPLYYTFIGVIPIAGSSIASFSISQYFKDFSETLRYLPLTIGLSLLTTFVITYNYLRNFVIESLVIVAVLPFAIAYLNSKRFDNIQINVNEYYIEILFKVPVKNYIFDDPAELFEYVYEKALKKVKPPYSSKLKALSSCGSLRVIPKEDYLILRKRCGDTSIEVKVYKDKDADLKVTMSY